MYRDLHFICIYAMRAAAH